MSPIPTSCSTSPPPCLCHLQQWCEGPSEGKNAYCTSCLKACYSQPARVCHTCKATVPDTTTSSNVKIWKTTTWGNIPSLATFSQIFSYRRSQSGDDRRRKQIWDDSNHFITNLSEIKANTNATVFDKNTSTLLNRHNELHTDNVGLTEVSATMFTITYKATFRIL